MRYKYMLFLLILLTACGKKRQVETSFYYWRTVYQQDSTENQYLKDLHCKQMYVRIADVTLAGWDGPIPRAPIGFAENLPDSVAMIPVVFIENEVFADDRNIGLQELPSNILRFVKGKVEQAGKKSFKEIQIDCDWTATSREKYFNFLKSLKSNLPGVNVSSTLRLHQLKNQNKMGIPPVDKVLLMCYNMGNLRKYGDQNSILDIHELKKYANQNLEYYKLPVDVALPLFNWSAVFRNKSFLGISYQADLSFLKNENFFELQNNGLYRARTDLAKLKIKKNDEVRYESSDLAAVKGVAEYLNQYLSEKPINLVFYHLNYKIIENYPTYELENISNLLR